MLLLIGSPGEITHVALSPDGRLVAASGGGRALEIWDTPDANKWGRYLDSLRLVDGSIAFHPTLPFLFATAMPGLAVVETDTKGADIAVEWRTPFGEGIEHFDVFPDGERIAYGAKYGDHGPDVRLGRWAPGKPLERVWRSPVGRVSRPWRSGMVLSLQVSADRETISSLELDRRTRRDVISRVVRSATTGEILAQTPPIPPPIPRQVAVTADGAWTVVRAGATLFAYPAAEPSRGVTVRTGSRKHFTGIAFHPSGKHLAATSNDETVRLYDTATWEVARTFTWGIGRLGAVAFSPDGTRAVVGSDSGKVLVWDVDL